MKTQKIEVGRDVVHIDCPHCDNWEQHPIDEQRHHIQSFSIEGWKVSDGVQISVTKCTDCQKTFELEWDYSNRLYKTFKVKVVRVRYESFDMEVEAESEEEAKQIALEDADENYWDKLKADDVKEDAVDYKLSDF